MNFIKTGLIFLLAAAVLVSMTAIAAEEKKLIEKLKDSDISAHIEIPACKADAATFCPGLPVSGKEAMTCLMAYEDNLSALCKLGIIEASLIFELGMLDIAFAIDACAADADKYCLDIEPGSGRMVSCLRNNESRISKQCVFALKETDLWQLGGTPN